MVLKPRTESWSISGWAATSSTTCCEREIGAILEYRDCSRSDSGFRPTRRSWSLLCVTSARGRWPALHTVPVTSGVGT